MDNLEEMDKFLEMYNLPIMNLEEREYMNRLIASKLILKSIIKYFSTNRSPGSDGFTGEEGRKGGRKEGRKAGRQAGRKSHKIVIRATKSGSPRAFTEKASQPKYPAHLRVPWYSSPEKLLFITGEQKIIRHQICCLRRQKSRI